MHFTIQSCGLENMGVLWIELEVAGIARKSAKSIPEGRRIERKIEGLWKQIHYWV